MIYPFGYDKLGDNPVIVQDISKSWKHLFVRLADNCPAGSFCGVEWQYRIASEDFAENLLKIKNTFATCLRYITFIVETEVVILFWYGDVSMYPKQSKLFLYASSEYAMTKLWLCAEVYMNSED